MSAIQISEETIVAMAREVIAREVAELRPLLREEILKSLQLVDEGGALSILPIRGKDPRRTFRRLANKHKLEYVRIDGFKWWKLSAIEALIEKHTVNGKRSEIGDQRSAGTQLRAVA
jgi:hypothetical protein